MPTVSVVMSVFNAQNYLADAIESILNQTYKDFEFIIINDGSTDKSLKIIEDYAKKDDRIIFISRENRGLIESLNEGIRISKGKYIARMDADDISLSQRFEKQIGFMENNPDVGILGSSVITFGKDLKERVWRLETRNDVLKAELLFSSCFAHPTVLIRKNLIEEYDLYYSHDFIHAEDFELWTRSAEYCKFANLKEPLLKYRILSNSVSRKADIDEEQRYEVIKNIFDKNLEKLGIKNSENENRLHFNLSVNHRIKNIKNKEMLYKYLKKILNHNKVSSLYDELSLKKTIGKKWLWYLYYKNDFSGLFSKHSLYGLMGLKK